MRVTNSQAWAIQVAIVAVLILAFKWVQLRGYVIPWRW